MNGFMQTSTKKPFLRWVVVVIALVTTILQFWMLSALQSYGSVLGTVAAIGKSTTTDTRLRKTDTDTKRVKTLLRIPHPDVLTNNKPAKTSYSSTNPTGPGMKTVQPFTASLPVRTLEHVPNSKSNMNLREFHKISKGSSDNLTIYIENFKGIELWYEYGTPMENAKCPLPENSLCIYQHIDKMADVVLRFVFFYVQDQRKIPFRYHNGQIVAMLNTEPEQPIMMEPLKKADIRIDHHLTSEITETEACMIPWKEDMYEIPDPSKRKGVAIFVSNCKAHRRSQYILELAKYIHIYSYGRCWHNVSHPPERKTFTTARYLLAKKHRIVVTFENTINHDYITEKIAWSYEAGAIPVYWGAPEIYLWTPGNHTFIDAQRFRGPKELAEYLRRVDEDDDLFRYHTTNFDYSVARKTHMDYCHSERFWCQLCTLAHKMKMKRARSEDIK